MQCSVAVKPGAVACINTSINQTESAYFTACSEVIWNNKVKILVTVAQDLLVLL